MNAISPAPAADQSSEAEGVSKIEMLEGEDRTIPLCKLVVSKRNVRKVGTPIDALKASIQHHGVLHNLIVTASKGGKFAVEAGGRRFRALTELCKEGKILKTYPVRCRVVSVEAAREVSLAENLMRQIMHPADAYEAFAALVDDGRSAQAIALRFGVSLTYVTQCLKLGRLSPKLLDLYREDQIKDEQIKALTLSDDHQEQEEAWFGSPEGYQRQPTYLRNRLTQEHIGHMDRRARFVGAEAYEEAGGRIVRDLFAHAEHGGFWTDKAIVHRLAEQKLTTAMEAIRAEGWAWGDIRLSLDHAELSAFERIYPEGRDYTDAETAEIEALTAEYDGIAADSSPTDEQRARADVIDQRLDELEEGLSVWTPEAMAQAGFIVTIDHSGGLAVEFGLIRPEDKRQPGGDDADGDGTGDDGEAEGRAVAAPTRSAEKPKKLSEALTLDLTAHRTVALRAALMDRPDVALVALVHKLALRVFYGSNGSALTIQADVTRSLKTLAPDIEDGAAFQAIHERREALEATLPHSGDALWGWLLQQEQAILMSLLAFCTAQTVDAVENKYEGMNGHLPAANAMAASVGLDMAAWWAPTAKGYFNRVSKDQILDAVREVQGAEAWSNIAGLKKGALAQEAERRLAGSGWLPEILRAAAVVGPAADEADDAQGGATAQEDTDALYDVAAE